MRNSEYIGIDETGIGCLAGPFVLAACVLPDKELPLIKDSKKVNKHVMASRAAHVKKHAIWSGVITVSVEQINKTGTWYSWELAIRDLIFRARESTGIWPVVVDGCRSFPNLGVQFFTKADAKFRNVSGASIIAKDFRDHIMSRHPDAGTYGWETNAGYGTNQHTEAIMEHGKSEWHRKAAVHTLLRNKRRKARR